MRQVPTMRGSIVVIRLTYVRYQTSFSPITLTWAATTCQPSENFTQLCIGAYFIKDYFMAGAWYRHTDPNADALSLLVGVKKDAVKIGYSYDITVSDARAAAIGSHEVSLIVEMKKYNHQQTRRWRKINCPSF